MSENEAKLVNDRGTLKIYFSGCTLLSPHFDILGDAGNLFMLLFEDQVILYSFHTIFIQLKFLIAESIGEVSEQKQVLGHLINYNCVRFTLDCQLEFMLCKQSVQ